MKGEIFHILNRGVDKREIFLKSEHYLRFAYNLYDFNDQNNITESYYRRKKVHRFGGPTLNEGYKNREELVDILSWCLMPNHFHLLVQEKIDGGSSLFAKKLTGGYTLHFNLENDRNGVLFQGGSKIIKILRDGHFFYLPYYIFSNPVDLMNYENRENDKEEAAEMLNFLENYQYSSFLDLVGKNNFPFVINKALFYELFNNDEEALRKDFLDWLRFYRENKEKGGFQPFED